MPCTIPQPENRTQSRQSIEPQLQTPRSKDLDFFMLVKMAPAGKIRGDETRNKETQMEKMTIRSRERVVNVRVRRN